MESSEFNTKTSSEKCAVIGPSIKVKGEITGAENILIHGAVEGSIVLTEHTVTIGEAAQIKANVSAREIRVEGEVTGDLVSRERVMICATGKVKGNIMSPCLSLEEGARLKGSIDTDSSIDDRVSVTVIPEKTERKTRQTSCQATSMTSYTDGLERSSADNGQVQKLAQKQT